MWFRSVQRLFPPGPFTLFREMFGWMREDNPFLNVSDGGHIENLGVYELLRRRCKFIVSVDGECDPNRVFDAVIKLIRYARIDLGAKIDIDLDNLRKDENGFSRAHAALGKITYSDRSIGWLLYLKPSLTGDELPDVLDYRREQPAFPHQTTLDQIYSEKQFEAYRALGEHSAEELFRDEILGAKGLDFAQNSRRNGRTKLSLWFEALAMNLLPEYDPVFLEDPMNLERMKIGISIGNVSPDELEQLDLDPEGVNEATATICEEPIRRGATVVFGHDWRNDGVMACIGEFARKDQLVNDRPEGSTVIVNRFPKALAQGSAGEVPEELKGLIDAQAFEGGVFELREELTRLCDARICIGGKLRDFSGPIPGIVEEAFRAARAGQPVFISGCLGGAARWMSDRLSGRQPTREPEYDGQAAAAHGLPASAEKLFDDLRSLFDQIAKEDPSVYELHERLWRTTTLDAARAVIAEILDIFGTRQSERKD